MKGLFGGFTNILRFIAALFIMLCLFVLLGMEYDDEDRDRVIENLVGTILFIALLAAIMSWAGVHALEILGVAGLTIFFLSMIFSLEAHLIDYNEQKEREKEEANKK